ncbi:MAG: hypothetical protein WKF43_12950 [Acidimicrobiales bacterium]
MAVEGSERYIEDRIPADAVPPVFEVTHADGWCSVTGGVVYRGEAIEGLAGAYLYGDFCKPELHALVLVDGEVAEERTLGRPVRGGPTRDQPSRPSQRESSISLAEARSGGSDLRATAVETPRRPPRTTPLVGV